MRLECAALTEADERNGGPCTPPTNGNAAVLDRLRVGVRGRAGSQGLLEPPAHAAEIGRVVVEVEDMCAPVDVLGATPRQTRR